MQTVAADGNIVGQMEHFSGLAFRSAADKADILVLIVLLFLTSLCGGSFIFLCTTFTGVGFPYTGVVVFHIYFCVFAIVF